MTEEFKLIHQRYFAHEFPVLIHTRVIGWFFNRRAVTTIWQGNTEGRQWINVETGQGTNFDHDRLLTRIYHIKAREERLKK